MSVRLIIIFISVLLVSVLAVGTISYFLNRNSDIQLHSERALDIARTISAAIDPVAYKETVETGTKTEYWHEVKGYLDTVITQNGLAYLYILQGYDANNVIYFAEGLIEGDTVASVDFNEVEDIEFYDENLLSVFAGGEVVSEGIYSAEEWGYLVSGIAPIFDETGAVIGVVGADVAVNEVFETANRFGLLILLLSIAIAIVAGIGIAWYLRVSLGNPISELTKVAQGIARGETDIEIKTKSRTEIGMLADSFREMIAAINEQAEVLHALAQGDLSVHIEARSEHDTMNIAIAETLDKLNDMLSQIHVLTGQVSAESGQISISAHTLARGASSQSSAVEELSSTISEIASQTRHNSDLAEASARLADTVREEATDSYTQMEQLIAAVKEINEASNSVRYVMKVIDEIAFHTNILSLNASVEAARAGEHGRGFDVVSREIQSLSKKTSESAKETAALVADTLSKTKQGVQLAIAVHETMQKVVTNVTESNNIANKIALSSKEQMIAIDQINQGINQVAVVVHQNSKAAEESASVSNQMNMQAGNLSALMSNFKTRD